MDTLATPIEPSDFNSTAEVGLRRFQAKEHSELNPSPLKTQARQYYNTTMTEDSAVNGGRNQSNVRGRYKGKDVRDEISPTVIIRNGAQPS
jgi:hypothetical protein